MIKKRIKILPGIKLAIIGFFLILIPCIILSYTDYKAISKNSESVRTNYESTVNLLRDKVEQEIISSEEKLSTELIELPLKAGVVNNLKTMLIEIEKHNPIIANSFLLKEDEGIVTTLITSKWQKSKIEFPQVSKYILSDFLAAEKIEYGEKDYARAADSYSKCLNYATSEDSVLLINRIARCFFYNHDNKKAIEAYKQLLNVKNTVHSIASVPAVVVALYQMADIYKTMNEEKPRLNTLFLLYEKLLDNTWDISDGKYFFYLKSVSDELQNLSTHFKNDNSISQKLNLLKKREFNIYEEARFHNFIRKKLQPEIGYQLKNQYLKNIKINHLLFQEDDSVFQLGYIIIPNQNKNTESFLFGYRIRNEYVSEDIFREALKKIDLGKSISFGLIDNKGRIVFPKNPPQNYKILLSGNFTKIFSSWKVVLFNNDGKSIEELVNQGKEQSLLLFGMTLIVIITGLFTLVYSAKNEYRISQMKSAFVSNVSHELKTPLSIIRMFSETLETGIVTDENKRLEFYGIMRRESERLTNLINNVLDFSKIESGKKEFNFEKSDLTEVVKNIIVMYKSQITAGGFEFVVNIPEREVIINIDKDAITQAILNILNNAIKYSTDRKYILIDVKAQSNNAAIAIADKGIGIPAKELDKIFGNFYRIQSSGNKQIKGTGLGLTITKYIVEAHHGKIKVESAVGQGSMFTIILPV